MEIPSTAKGWANAVVIVAVAGFILATAINFFPALQPIGRGLTRQS